MVMSRERKADPALFPEWLQILRPKRDDGESTDRELSMTGRVKIHVSAEASALRASIIAKEAEVEALRKAVQDQQQAQRLP